MLLALHDSSISVQYFCFCFDMFRDFFFFSLNHQLGKNMHWNQVIQVWAFKDRLIQNKQIHTCTVRALQSTVNMSSKNQNVHIQLCVRKTQLSINQVSVYTRPKFFPLLSLICGENTYCSFSVVLNQDLSNKNEKFQRLRSKKSEEVIPHTVLTVYIYTYIYFYIYIYKWWIHIYCYLRAVERRASRCWCSMGNPLHCQGSPVSTGCWEVLGYWVCLSLDQGSYRNRQ